MMVNVNNKKSCQFPFKNNKYYKMRHAIKRSYGDKTDNRQKW